MFKNILAIHVCLRTAGREVRRLRFLKASMLVFVALFLPQEDMQGDADDDDWRSGHTCHSEVYHIVRKPVMELPDDADHDAHDREPAIAGE